MIPGRETCPSHWKKEYTGYIMSGHLVHKSTKPYLCIDDKPQVVRGPGPTLDSLMEYCTWLKHSVRRFNVNRLSMEESCVVLFVQICATAKGKSE